MNEWMNEWMNERMNEIKWTNEKMNEWYFISHSIDIYNILTKLIKYELTYNPDEDTLVPLSKWFLGVLRFIT